MSSSPQYERLGHNAIENLSPIDRLNKNMSSHKICNNGVDHSFQNNRSNKLSMYLAKIRPK